MSETTPEPTTPTTPTAPAPKDSGTVDPDNWHIDGTKQAAPDGLLTGNPATPAAKPGDVQPDNWHIDGTKA